MGAAPEKYPANASDWNTAWFNTNVATFANADTATSAGIGNAAAFSGIDAKDGDTHAKVADYDNVLFKNFLLQAKIWPSIAAWVSQSEREAIIGAAGKYMGNYPQVYENWKFNRSNCRNSVGDGAAVPLVAMPDTATAGKMTVNLCKQLCIDAGTEMCDGIEYIHGHK